MSGSNPISNYQQSPVAQGHIVSVQPTSTTSQGQHNVHGLPSTPSTPTIPTDSDIQSLLSKVKTTSDFRSKPDSVLLHRVIGCTILGALCGGVPAVIGFLLGGAWGLWARSSKGAEVVANTAFKNTSALIEESFDGPNYTPVSIIEQSNGNFLSSPDMPNITTKPPITNIETSGNMIKFTIASGLLGGGKEICAKLDSGQKINVNNYKKVIFSAIAKDESIKLEKFNEKYTPIDSPASTDIYAWEFPDLGMILDALMSC